MRNGRSESVVENKNRRIFHGYIVAVFAFIVVAVAGGTWVVFSVFFGPMLEDFGWTRAALAGAPSLCTLILTLFAIPGGKITDRFGPRPYVTLCGLLVGLSLALMSQVSTIWQLYLVYGVMLGIGQSGLWVPMTVTMARWFEKRRGMMIGIILAGGGLGITLMPPLASRLIVQYGWRDSAIIVGVITGVLVLVAAQFIKRDPRTMGLLPYGLDEVESKGVDIQAGGFSLGQAIRSREFWMVCALFSCLWFSANTIYVHIVVHAIDLGVSEINAANLPAIIGGVGIVARVVMGSAADRIGYRPTLLIGFGLMASSLLWLQVASELWMLYLFAGVFGLGFAGLAVLEGPLAARLFGLAALGVILGSIEFVTAIFGAASPILVGYLFDIMGGYQTAFLITALVSVTGLILSLILKPNTRKGEANGPEGSP
jgi:MFS family permease